MLDSEMARFMLATGLRLGETLGVTWADLDLTAGTVAVHRTVFGSRVRAWWRSGSSHAPRSGAVRGGSSFEWVKTHTYRKTVATLLDQSGASARMIADQLGHSRVSMTQDVYLGRRAANTGNLAALEAYDPGPATSEAPDTEDE